MLASCRDCRHFRATDGLALVGVCEAPTGLHTGRIQPHYQCCTDFEAASDRVAADPVGFDLLETDECGSCPHPTCNGDHT